MCEVLFMPSHICIDRKFLGSVCKTENLYSCFLMKATDRISQISTSCLATTRYYVSF